jgi:DnaK suppressor protein
MGQSGFDVIRKTLETERQAIERQLTELGASLDRDGLTVSGNEGFADSAQATAERSEIISHVEQLRSNHVEVTAALKRIDEGTYGKCERCGESIPIERLEAMPKASLCVKCKEEAAR